jgi:hypothetical protein
VEYTGVENLEHRELNWDGRGKNSIIESICTLKKYRFSARKADLFIVHPSILSLEIGLGAGVNV